MLMQRLAWKLKERPALAKAIVSVATVVTIAIYFGGARPAAYALLNGPTDLYHHCADWLSRRPALSASAGAITGIVSVMLILINRRVAIQKSRLSTAINNMTQGLLLFDANRRVIICNQRYIDIYGLSPDIIKPGARLREVIEHRKERGSIIDDVDAFCERIAENLLIGGHPFVLRLNDGRSIQILDRPMMDGGWVSTHEDITERQKLVEKITYMAHYDGLTGLANRAQFSDRLASDLMEIKPARRLALLYIDLDLFKTINDSFGHPVGDELLRIVAIRMKECVAEHDLVARLGGDEFAVIRTEVSRDSDIDEFAMRLHQKLREPFNCLGHQLLIEASIGIAIAPEGGIEPGELLKNADAAMYDAKSGGRGTHRFFDTGLMQRSGMSHSLGQDLRRAAATKDFVTAGFELHYQPIVNLVDNSIVACEALIRWRHSERGMISPCEFIPIAEETGLIIELGEWILTAACEEAAKWPSEVKVAINVSPVQFRSETLPLKVLTALDSAGLSPHRLELEITEAVHIGDDDIALIVLHQLRAAGVRVALDDFGTGYSSLSYLQRFPFDKIKIDRCFVNNPASSSIIKAIIDIAKAGEMRTTAEGVETEDQRLRVLSLGCTEMQGFLFSRPLPVVGIRALLGGSSERLRNVH
jgi:diguanylate cyclase (GGDEF)-like protein